MVKQPRVGGNQGLLVLGELKPMMHRKLLLMKLLVSIEW